MLALKGPHNPSDSHVLWTGRQEFNAVGHPVRLNEWVNIFVLWICLPTWTCIFFFTSSIHPPSRWIRRKHFRFPLRGSQNTFCKSAGNAPDPSSDIWNTEVWVKWKTLTKKRDLIYWTISQLRLPDCVITLIQTSLSEVQSGQKQHLD